jgi:sigma-B regulation protein RsbU (phosphoserine phosphatase)
VTLLYGVLRPDGHLTYCNAGHNPPFLVGSSGVHRLETGGLIVGLFGGAEFEQEILQLQAGDVLVVFTDGVSEVLSKDGEEFGDDRILEAIRANQDASTQAMLEAVFESVAEFTIGAEQNDDMTAMVVRYLGDG